MTVVEDIWACCWKCCNPSQRLVPTSPFRKATILKCANPTCVYGARGTTELTVAVPVYGGCIDVKLERQVCAYVEKPKKIVTRTWAWQRIHDL